MGCITINNSDMKPFNQLLGWCARQRNESKQQYSQAAVTPTCRLQQYATFTVVLLGHMDVSHSTNDNGRNMRMREHQHLIVYTMYLHF